MNEQAYVDMDRAVTEKTPEVLRRYRVVPFLSGFVILLLLGLLVAFAVAQWSTLNLRLAVQERLAPAGRSITEATSLLATQVAAARGYLITQNPAFLDEYLATRHRSEGVHQELEVLTSDLPVVQQQVAVFLERSERWARFTDSLLEEPIDPGTQAGRIPEQQQRLEAAIEAARLARDRISELESEILSEIGAVERLRLILFSLISIAAILSMAGVIWTARQLSRLSKQAAWQAREDRSLREIAGLFAGNLPLQDVVKRVIEHTSTLLKAQGAHIEQVSTSREMVEVIFARGITEPLVGIRVPFPGSLTAEVIGKRTWEITKVDDVLRSGRPMAESLHKTCGDCWVLAVPLISVEEALGALIYFRTPDRVPFSQEEAERVQVLGSLAALALRRAAVDEETQYREEILHFKNAELERSNEALEEFAHIASHDLREPLRTVSMLVQMLSSRYEGKLDEDADQMIGYIQAGTNRMQELINDILTLSKIGAQPMERKNVHAGDIVESAMKNIQARIEEADAEVMIAPLPDLSVNSFAFRQLFENLVSNAVKFRSPDRKPQIRIEANRQDDAWLFSVSDNGIGIPEEYHASIFNVFQRLHSRNEFEGTGIGLAICKKIVERHNGRLWVESSPDQGSTFYFTVPENGLQPQG